MPLLDEVEQSVRQDGTFMRNRSLEGIAEIRRRDAAGEAIPSHQLAGLIGTITLECEKDVGREPERALRKITLGLRLIDAWQDRLAQGASTVSTHQVTLLMLRWFLRGDAADQQRAHQIVEALDRSVTDPKEQGRATYRLAADYEDLARMARTAGRGREQQIALLRDGIALNKAGRARYPAYDSMVGLNALYGKLQFVSGGSALPAYLDEWLSYLKTLPAESQAKSGQSISGALFQQGRDDEAVEWLTRYFDYWESAPMPPALQTRFRESRCVHLGGDDDFAAFEQRAPSRAAPIRERACAGVKLEFDVQQAVDALTSKD
ncbi:hypothetical protein ACQ859_14170 [Roseateles chitinivorans]|uniref:hypothetical protein n=1 Tax=Roseateles chitinivorans TaxID=2917965 RepID=UPI003D677AC8